MYSTCTGTVHTTVRSTTGSILQYLSAVKHCTIISCVKKELAAYSARYPACIHIRNQAGTGTGYKKGRTMLCFPSLNRHCVDWDICLFKKFDAKIISSHPLQVRQ